MIACTSFFETLVGSVNNKLITLAIEFGPFVRFISRETTQETSSLVSRLETQFLILEILETRLEPRFLKISRIESRDAKIETLGTVNLHLTGTVPQAASRNSEGEEGYIDWNSEDMGGSLDWNSEGMGVGVQESNFQFGVVKSLKGKLIKTTYLRTMIHS